ncbi:putative BOI-related E3 ubiquitin-protein ligase 3 [Ananas comosus]|uniref:Putative BOI-related E3 ubiquitin-protein ligase 3 n=1 Tax=Ananas comosus TaxID=4615 RepID=A0A199W8W3_ANACO|nr:putative BOI-related E3 ubiquitin-protein ligase 3 [Ananas comosus]
MVMAVQAQYPSNAASPDFRGRVVPRNSVFEELQMVQDRNLLGAYGLLANNGGAAVVSDPQSDLTCNNAPGSRKRARAREADAVALPWAPPPNPNPNGSSISHLQGFRIPVPIPAAKMAAAEAAVVASQTRVLGSGDASTSGRAAAAAAAAAGSSPSPLAYDLLLSHLCHHNAEIDALVRLQNERLRSGLEEARKRHCGALLAAAERGAARRLREKEVELEAARRRNAELEEKVRQLAAESQIWFNVARNNEALASSLRASLDHLLLQQQQQQQHHTSSPLLLPEGFGDSSPAIDDAQSCCFAAKPHDDDNDDDDEEVGIRSERARVCCCRACGDAEACVLLLPCRHLCLCRACESKSDACPLCHVPKNASLQIFTA